MTGLWCVNDGNGCKAIAQSVSERMAKIPVIGHSSIDDRADAMNTTAASREERDWPLLTEAPERFQVVRRARPASGVVADLPASAWPRKRAKSAFFGVKEESVSPSAELTSEFGPFRRLLRDA